MRCASADHDAVRGGAAHARWLLREAVRCGLILGPQGVCLQPALPPPETIPLPADLTSTLDRLHKLKGYLRLRERSIAPGAQPDLAIDGLLRDITQPDLGALVEYMARLDASASPGVVDADGELLPDMAQAVHESLSLAWKILSFVPMKPQRFRRADITNTVR